MPHRSLRCLPLALLLAGCAQGGLAAVGAPQDAVPEPTPQDDTACRESGVRPMAIAEPRASASGYAAIGQPAPPAPDLGPLEPFVGDFATGTDYLTVWNGRRYEPMFLKGVNLGLGLPGTFASDYVITYRQYLRWFDKMRELGINVVRIYTLHPPAFYQALSEHNLTHTDKPIYVMHGAWLGDPDLTSAATRDLHASTGLLDARIEEVVDAVHGNKTIAPRLRAAYGVYATDVSRWVIGFLVGREVLAEEVQATDLAHPEEVSFEGVGLQLAAGNPSSVWVTARLDHTIAYERARYGVNRPVAFSNWLETDPLTHPTEPRSSRKDIATIDTSKVVPHGAPTGLFASFHVYPYYPDFMSEEPGYQSTTDTYGNDSYRGYLKALKAYHGKMPLLVAEFGVPSSWGIAKYASNGMHHGGHSEQMQAEHTQRMVGDIYAEKLAGAVSFGWMDGWFKQIWITRELAFPADRSPLWHDVTNAQQFYGLMAFDVGAPDFAAMAPAIGRGRVLKTEAAADAEFFHTRISLASPLADGETLTVGYDTYRDDLGESVLPDGAHTNRRSELALTIVGGDATARLRVMRSYDLYLVTKKQKMPWSILQSTTSDAGDWVDILRNNATAHGSDDHLYSFPAADQPIGVLSARRAGGEVSTLDAVVVGRGTVAVRIPWSLLQFTDPSARRVMHDDAATPAHETAVSEGIGLVVSVGGEKLETPRFTWPTWTKAPPTTERYRPVAAALGASFALIPRRMPAPAPAGD
ncbi:MAG TPA: hypothetical protein VLT33_35965 [Labilithrix sp.]|nr:hypothetical protein [Labilithrix sp.]